MENGEERINCPMFLKHESVIKRVTDSINRSKDLEGKIRNAEKLLSEVDTILGCPDYKKENPDCSNCHFIANIRSQTAGVIIKAKKLSRRNKDEDLSNR